jgi:4-methylaminobutanoate oxidase (formaldehyde-forming)
MTGFSEHLRKDAISASTFDPSATGKPPARARAVVIGGGIIGAATAFHLAELGWTDTVVLERHSITSGTTWHAAGLVTRTRPTHAQTELARYSGDFFKGLQERSGVDIGYYESGALSLAQSRDRMVEIDYVHSVARHHGLPVHRLGPAQIAAAFPLLETRDLVGGVLFEGDATVNPGLAGYATAKAAFDIGVRIVEGVTVTGFRLSGGRVTGVETDRGLIECEVAVIAAGLWSRDVALLAGANVPVQAVQHVWVQTAEVDGATRDLPIVRDLDGNFYARHYRGGLVIGAFAPGSRSRSTSSIPEEFAFGEFEPDWAHMARPLANARHRIPHARDVQVVHFLNAPESFTPDAVFLMGETAEVEGLFVAAGMNSQGIIFGPGVGRALAEWIDEGAPTVDVAELDVRRYAAAQNNERYLLERAPESLARLYTMHYPFLQPVTARGLRRVPLYERLAAAGAVFGEGSGWERPNWYAPPGMAPVYGYSFGRQNWFEAVGEEHRAARERVALFDLSPFAKVRVEGPHALETVQRVFSADLDRAPGSVAYTCMLNRNGGTEMDLTVTRLGEQSFLVVAPSFAQAKTFHWLRRNADPAVVVSDLTSGLGVLGVMGPHSRELLSRLTNAPLDDAAFPFATAQRIDVGWASVLALRVSFVGELGWELYAPVESLLTLYEGLLQAGGDLRLRLAGFHALDSLRAEKGLLDWGLDIGPADTPYEAGIGFTVALDKPAEFIGREALRARAREPLSRRLVHLKLDDPAPLLYRGESIVLDGRIVGSVTSAGYGHTIGAAVGLGYVNGAPDELKTIVTSGAVQIDVAGTLVPATLSLRPFYDPDGERMRGAPLARPPR